MTLTVSIVSHSHGVMVVNLVQSLLEFEQVDEIIVTLNVPEYFPEIDDTRVCLIKNTFPKGFGANHNAAFALTNNQFYCVINPDIELVQNPFVELVAALSDQRVGLVAPLVFASNRAPEDSMRRFLTPWSMTKRFFGLDSGAYSLRQDGANVKPDWVAGMFMLFRSEAYSKVGGFDERYFMYCEDADICTRLWKAGYAVVGCLSASVIHNAQRASHRSFKHLFWHLRSMTRYFLTYVFSLPSKQIDP